MKNGVKDFSSIIQKLKTTKRQGWKERGLVSDSISEHAYGAMCIGWKLAIEEKADVQKVIEILLIHDWIMSVIPDVTPKSGKYEGKGKLEDENKNRIAFLLGKDLTKRFLKLFDEYKQSFTFEAKVAREADKLETLLQADTFEEQTKRNDILDEFLYTYSNVFNTKKGKEMFNDISERHKMRKFHKSQYNSLK